MSIAAVISEPARISAKRSISAADGGGCPQVWQNGKPIAVTIVRKLNWFRHF
jgi:hypothetical protein